MTDGKWAFNDIKRRGGRFLWEQIVHAKRMNSRFIYGAMWDECVPFSRCSSSAPRVV
jgi:hypothetical protein